MQVARNFVSKLTFKPFKTAFTDLHGLFRIGNVFLNTFIFLVLIFGAYGTILDKFLFKSIYTS
jgi:hypothetical protein